VKLFSYQCSQHSTPDSILEIFSNAQKFQESKDIKQFVSVVVLDEVGLAEDSPSLPLKALHPLLEDGTSGADTAAQVISHCKTAISLHSIYQSEIISTCSEEESGTVSIGYSFLRSGWC